MSWSFLSKKEKDVMVMWPGHSLIITRLCYTFVLAMVRAWRRGRHACMVPSGFFQSCSWIGAVKERADVTKWKKYHSKL